MIDPVNLRLALISAAALGFRHGLDYDHIAAITDISSVQSKARDSMKYGLLYVAGHATTVATIGRGGCCVPHRIASGDRSLGGTAGRNNAASSRAVRAGYILSSGNAYSCASHAPYTTGERNPVDVLEA